jgi:hypothetical protein
MLALTYRIIGDSSKKLRKVVVIVMAVICLQGTIFVFTAVFQCRYADHFQDQTEANLHRPISQYWTLSMEPQKCISEPAFLLASGIINTVTDFIVVILPVPVVWKLQLGRREQLVLVLLFGAGFIVSIVGGIRTVYTYRVTVSNDRSWDIFPVYITASVELYVGIVSQSVHPKDRFLISSDLRMHTCNQKVLQLLHAPSHGHLQSFTSVNFYETKTDTF